MKLFLLLITVLFLSAPFSNAQASNPDYQFSYVKGKVIKIISSKVIAVANIRGKQEHFITQILEGKEKNKIITLDYFANKQYGKGVAPGDTIIVRTIQTPENKIQYEFYGTYQLPIIFWFLTGFILLLFIVAGKKGIRAFLGLTISVTVLITYIAPAITRGIDPLVAATIGAVVILLLTTYITHGVSLKTTVAIISTGFSLLISIMFSSFCVHLLGAAGVADENTKMFILNNATPINPQNLLLAGILIGSLGALNDITTTQSITLFALAKENPKQHLSHLFRKGILIGQEHIASLINTLVLAYAGTSLVVFFFISLNPNHIPWWALLNNGLIVEELLRAFIGSVTLILSIPIVTLLGSYTALHKDDIRSFILLRIH